MRKLVLPKPSLYYSHQVPTIAHTKVFFPEKVCPKKPEIQSASKNIPIRPYPLVTSYPVSSAVEIILLDSKKVSLNCLKSSKKDTIGPLLVMYIILFLIIP